MLVVESTRVELFPPADSRIEMGARGPRIPAAISLSLYYLRVCECAPGRNTKLTAETLYPRRGPACFVEIRDAGLKLTGVLHRWGRP
jgi:hypothetical protein